MRFGINLPWSDVGAASALMTAITSESVEDRFHDLAAALAALRDDVRRDMARFPAVRLATREELYRRLYRARDFIASCYAEPLSVADVARVAAMSPFHRCCHPERERGAWGRGWRMNRAARPPRPLAHARGDKARALFGAPPSKEQF